MPHHTLVVSNDSRVRVGLSGARTNTQHCRARNFGFTGADMLSAKEKLPIKVANFNCIKIDLHVR